MSHTDAKGSDDYNMALSDRLAVSVGTWLAARGIKLDRMTTRPRGESEPVAPNTLSDGDDNPEGRQLNRRVEFTILQPKF
nr:OmpA family protein [Paracoccus tegillarcae]